MLGYCHAMQEVSPKTRTLLATVAGTATLCVAGRWLYNRMLAGRSAKTDRGAMPTDDESIRAMARQIFTSGCEAVDPSVAMRRDLSLDRHGKLRIGREVAVNPLVVPVASLDTKCFTRILVIGIGKACVRMAEGVEAVLGDKIEAGFLITKYDHSKGHTLTSKFQIREAAHPTPDDAGVSATRELLKFLEGIDEKTLVLCCITGGGTALLCAPQAPLTLPKMSEATRCLLGCGCPIEEKNAVVKHLEEVKGGRLAQICEPATLVSLIVSDVVGDPLDTIASGPTVPDAENCTFEHCIKIIDRYPGLRQKLPLEAIQILEEGVKGLRRDTPKAGASAFHRSVVHIAASNEVAVNSCVAKARSLGFNAMALSSFMEGEATELAKAYIGLAKEVAKNGRPVELPAVIVGGGETTVTLPENHGLGGRSQALALSAMVGIDGMSGVAILAGGTDGGDGPCDAAGAVVTGGDAECARKLAFKAEDFLRRADSFNFFKDFETERYGKSNIMHLRDGPTGTNVMDLVIVLVTK